MTTALRSRSTPRWFARATAPLLLVLGLVLAGCATQREVAQIVANSNAAMLADRFVLPAESGGSPTSSEQVMWQEFDRIESFIAAHADPQFLGMTTALRVRQAVLLLNHKQFNLAKAAFAAVDSKHLHTARDQALLRSKETLLWWFATSSNPTWTDADRAASEKAMKQLHGEQETLGDSPDIRDYLAEMRAWIGIAAANRTLSPSKRSSLLKEAIDGYAKIFTADDLTALGALAAPDEDAGPPMHGLELRRRLRAVTVLDAARKSNLELAVAERAQVATPVFDQWISKNP